MTKHDIAYAERPRAQTKRPDKPAVCLVIPVFNEEDSILPFLETITPIVRATGLPYRLLFVNDGSSDTTLDVLRHCKTSYPEITIVALSRNFGKEAALTAGLDYADEDVVILIDVDLQDPPELITAFLDQWRKGFDVVYGVRTARAGDSFAKRSTASAFYKVFNAFSLTKIPPNTGDFRLIDRRVVGEIRKLRERNRFMKGLLAWPGFRSIGVPFERQPRKAGSTSWNYWKLWNFAIDGLTSFSSIGLRLWMYVGSMIALISLVFAAFIILRTLFFGADVAGYPSLMVALSFFSGVQLITLGLIGEYLGRIFEEVKGRPLYIIDTFEE